MAEQSPELPNFHEVSRERRVVRKALHEAQGNALPEPIISGLAEEKERLNKEAKDFPPADQSTLSEAKEFLRSQKKESEDSIGIDEHAIRAELGDEYEKLKSLSDKLHDLSDFELRRLREGASDTHAKRAYESLLAQIKKEKTNIAEALSKEEEANPNTARAYELVSLRKDLFEEGHIAHTPSIDRYLGEIGRRMIHGKPMFIHGPTGTGKTSLARYAAKYFTGKNAEMVYCTPQTRESHIWGKTGIRPSGVDGAIETVEIFGPLARSMQDGTTVVFDEFTALPREQMVFLKGVANAKHGDTISVPGNGETVIAPGFQMIFTANLKSEKNPERQELPPEIAREFEQNNLEMKYTPKDEAYDIMLARLMKPDGTLTLSWHDLTTTLSKLCEAMEEIQIAYADSANSDTAKIIGATNAAGKKPRLKKFVMTQGTIEAVLESWGTERQLNESVSFSEFLDDRLSTGITFKEYPEGDRVLAAKILALKGFLRTKTAEDLWLPKDTFNFDAAKKQRENKDAIKKLRAESGKEVTLSLREVADLDPFGKKASSLKNAAEDLLDGEGAPDDEFLSGIKKRAGKIFGEEGLIDLNPETQGLDFEKLKVFIPDLSQFNGKPLHEVMKYVNYTYGATHHIPGIEYWKWLIENPGKNPPNQDLKDGKYCFFPGSVLRDRDGRWRVPCLGWRGAAWRRSADWLASDWVAAFRVVLLEK